MRFYYLSFLDLINKIFIVGKIFLHWKHLLFAFFHQKWINYWIIVNLFDFDLVLLFLILLLLIRIVWKLSRIFNLKNVFTLRYQLNKFDLIVKFNLFSHVFYCWFILAFIFKVYVIYIRNIHRSLILLIKNCKTNIIFCIIFLLFWIVLIILILFDILIVLVYNLLGKIKRVLFILN